MVPNLCLEMMMAITEAFWRNPTLTFTSWLSKGMGGQLTPMALGELMRTYLDDDRHNILELDGEG